MFLRFQFSGKDTVMKINEIVKNLIEKASDADDSYFADLADFQEEHGDEEEPRWEDPIVYLTRGGDCGWYWGGDAQASHDAEHCLKWRHRELLDMNKRELSCLKKDIQRYLS